MRRTNSLAATRLPDDQDAPVSEELVAAWTADPRCAECGEPVRSVLEAALLVERRRVTHRERCFIPALVRGHPHLTLLTAPRRTQEGRENPGISGEATRPSPTRGHTPEGSNG